MSINIESLRQKVNKAILKMPSVVQVYRSCKNEFGEADEDIFITELTGQYYDKQKGVYINVSMGESGAVKDKNKEKFMTIINENSLLVKENDFFELKGKRYKITDLGNTMDIYFDFSIEPKHGEV